MTDKNSKETLLQIPSVLKERYQIVKKLGGGGFGEIYEGRILETGQSCAVKVESNMTSKQVLKMEAAVLRKLQNIDCKYACQFLGAGKTDKVNFVVMSLLGSNLSELRKKQPEGRFTWSTTFRLAVQLLRGIRAVHDCGFLHRDIKPSNFAMGSQCTTRHVCYILDFGLARQYITATGEIRDPRPIAGFRGTVRYASINAHRSVEMGRHDDLWSLFYMLMEFLHGQLPWRRLKEKEEVAREKETFDHREFLVGLPEEFEGVLDHLEGLDYYSSPDYGMVESTFAGLVAKYGFAEFDPLDWEVDLAGSVPTTSGVSHQAVRGGPSGLEKIVEIVDEGGGGNRDCVLPVGGLLVGGSGGVQRGGRVVMVEQGTKTHCSGVENFNSGGEDEEERVGGRRNKEVVVDCGRNGVRVESEKEVVVETGAGVLGREEQGLAPDVVCIGGDCVGDRMAQNPSTVGGVDNRERLDCLEGEGNEEEDDDEREDEDEEIDENVEDDDVEEVEEEDDDDDDDDDEEEEKFVNQGRGDVLAQVNQIFDESEVNLNSHSSLNPVALEYHHHHHHQQQQQQVVVEQAQMVEDGESGRDDSGGAKRGYTKSSLGGFDQLVIPQGFNSKLITDSVGMGTAANSDMNTVVSGSAGGVVGLSTGVGKDGVGLQSDTAAAKLEEVETSKNPSLRPIVRSGLSLLPRDLDNNGCGSGDGEDGSGEVKNDDGDGKGGGSPHKPLSSPQPIVTGEKCSLVDPTSAETAFPGPLPAHSGVAEWLPGNRNDGFAEVGDLNPHPKPNNHAFSDGEEEEKESKSERRKKNSSSPSPQLLSLLSGWKSSPSSVQPQASSEAGQIPLQGREGGNDDSNDKSESEPHLSLPDGTSSHNNNNNNNRLGRTSPSPADALSHTTAPRPRPNLPPLPSDYEQLLLRSSQPSLTHSLATLEKQGALAHFRDSQLFFRPHGSGSGGGGSRGGVDDSVDPLHDSGGGGGIAREGEERELAVSIEAPSSQRLPSDPNDPEPEGGCHDHSPLNHHHHILHDGNHLRGQDGYLDDQDCHQLYASSTQLDSCRYDHHQQQHGDDFVPTSATTGVNAFITTQPDDENYNLDCNQVSHPVSSRLQPLPVQSGQQQVPVFESEDLEWKRHYHHGNDNCELSDCITEDVSIESSLSLFRDVARLVMVQNIVREKGGSGGTNSYCSDSFEEEEESQSQRDRVPAVAVQAEEEERSDDKNDKEGPLLEVVVVGEGGDHVRSQSSSGAQISTLSGSTSPRPLLPLTTVVEEEAPVIAGPPPVVTAAPPPKGVEPLLSTYDSNSRILSPIEEEEAIPAIMPSAAEAGPVPSHLPTSHRISAESDFSQLKEVETPHKEKKEDPSSIRSAAVATGDDGVLVSQPPPPPLSLPSTSSVGQPGGLSAAVVWELLGVENCDPVKPLPLPRPPSERSSLLVTVVTDSRRRRFKQIPVKPTVT